MSLRCANHECRRLLIDPATKKPVVKGRRGEESTFRVIPTDSQHGSKIYFCSPACYAANRTFYGDSYRSFQSVASQWYDKRQSMEPVEPDSPSSISGHQPVVQGNDTVEDDAIPW